jgi:protein TonB
VSSTPAPAPGSNPVPAETAAATAPTDPAVSRPVEIGVRPGDLLPLTEVDVRPNAVRNPPPEYHPIARQLRQQGTVVLNVLIREDGTVEDVQVLREIPRSRLNDAAVRAVERWTYTPASKDGVPVKVWKTEAIHFRL